MGGWVGGGLDKPASLISLKRTFNIRYVAKRPEVG